MPRYRDLHEQDVLSILRLHEWKTATEIFEELRAQRVRAAGLWIRELSRRLVNRFLTQLVQKDLAARRERLTSRIRRVARGGFALYEYRLKPKGLAQSARLTVTDDMPKRAVA